MDCTRDIGMIILFLIVIFLVIKIQKISKNKENFALGPDDLTVVRNEINRIYDMDVEAIRNLGAISKSLLTGTNTFTASTTGIPGTLTIPANNIITQKDLSVTGNTSVTGDLFVHGKQLIPLGIIMAWYQPTAPAGWGLCNGTKYGNIQSPDLRGRFIKMATENTSATEYTPTDTTTINKDYNTSKRGSTKALILPHIFGKNGGSDVRTLDISELPKHTHSTNLRRISTWNNNTWGQNALDTDTNIAAKASIVTDDMTTGDLAFGILPPYHVLVYIIYIG